MNNTKLHINLNQGLIEAEGSEEFVSLVYNDFKDKIGSTLYSPKDTGQQNNTPLSVATTQPSAKKNPASKTKTTKKKALAKSYTLLKDLNLYTEGEKPSLEDFMKSYNANSNPPRYLLFTHYLKNIKGIKTVGPNEIYTCLKTLGSIKIPNIEQGLWDTASKKGWLDTSSIDDISIPVAGENAIDHKLLKKQKEEAA